MKNRTTQSSWLLWLGFGGLLFLLAFAGLYGQSTIQSIGTRNEQIRANYLQRDRILQQVRADLYLSGTYIRTCSSKLMGDKRNYTASHFGTVEIKWPRIARSMLACSAPINVLRSTD